MMLADTKVPVLVYLPRNVVSVAEISNSSGGAC